jgi:hypothetical protein
LLVGTSIWPLAILLLPLFAAGLAREKLKEVKRIKTRREAEKQKLRADVEEELKKIEDELIIEESQKDWQNSAHT